MFYVIVVDVPEQKSILLSRSTAAVAAVAAAKSMFAWPF